MQTVPLLCPRYWLLDKQCRIERQSSRGFPRGFAGTRAANGLPKADILHMVVFGGSSILTLSTRARSLGSFSANRAFVAFTGVVGLGRVPCDQVYEREDDGDVHTSRERRSIQIDGNCSRGYGVFERAGQSLSSPTAFPRPIAVGQPMPHVMACFFLTCIVKGDE